MLKLKSRKFFLKSLNKSLVLMKLVEIFEYEQKLFQFLDKEVYMEFFVLMEVGVFDGDELKLMVCILLLMKLKFFLNVCKMV